MTKDRHTNARVGLPAGLREPVRIDLSEGSRRRAGVTHVDVVIPCFNRQSDLDLLLADLAGLRDAPARDHRRVEMRIIVVDNASEPPLVVDGAAGVEVYRLATNTGGSGGFNAGMSRALGASPPLDGGSGGLRGDADFLWLIDSDARVRSDTLERLLRAADRAPDAVVLGAAIADPRTGRVFEVGGYVCRSTGRFRPCATGSAGLEGGLLACDYVAACCALVRPDAVRSAGLMPDVFLNGDDVEWCLRLSSIGGGRVVAVPDAVAEHPTFDRFQTWARYYHARNAFGAIDALRLGRGVRFRRGLIETGRAVQQVAMGRDDLVSLHLRGLRDAGNRDALGRAEAPVDPMMPLERLPSLLADEGCDEVQVVSDVHLPESVSRALRDGVHDVSVRAVPDGGLMGAIRRVVSPDRSGVSVVACRGRPSGWWRSGTTIQLCEGGFRVVRDRSWLAGVRGCSRAAWAGMRGAYLSARLALRRDVERRAIPAAPHDPQTTPTVTIVILSYNRWSALERTISRLLRVHAVEADSILVVDNASTDESVAHLRERFPGVRVMVMEENLGVEAFNRGVRACDSDLVLILDDDACPDEGVLDAAVILMSERPRIGAVALHPVHPSTGESEWPFGVSVSRSFPAMGCGNLVRRDVWLRLGGYESGYWLYRNDTDLALRVLALGYEVHFDPKWVVWHDSPAAASKSLRWHELATRNWIWMARRHGGRGWGVAGGLLGWVWAHRLAGIRVRAHWATLRGAWSGVMASPPSTRYPGHRGYRDLIRSRLEGRAWVGNDSRS